MFLRIIDNIDQSALFGVVDEQTLDILILIIYHNTMLSQDVLIGYQIAAPESPVCLDGAKRDRRIWTGDFYHIVRVIAASAVRWDYIFSSTDCVFRRPRMTPHLQGFVPINAPISGRPEDETRLTHLKPRQLTVPKHTRGTLVVQSGT